MSKNNRDPNFYKEIFKNYIQQYFVEEKKDFLFSAGKFDLFEDQYQVNKYLNFLLNIF
jgi:hypothetical protein